MLEYPLSLVFPVAMAFAAANDLLTMTIPNRISIALVAAFLLVAPLHHLSGAEFLQHLAAGGIVLLAGIAMFAFGWMGGGDAKLLAATSLWFGLDGLAPYLSQVATLGGFLAVAILLYRQYVPVGALPGPAWALRLHAKGSGIPYGLAIAAAALIMYPHTKGFAVLAG